MTTVVGDWKRKSNYDRIYLTNAPWRELVLTGSSESKERYRGARFRYDEASGLEILGWFQGKGFVAVRPTLNRRGLTLPLGQGADILNVIRPIEDLHGGPSPSSHSELPPLPEAAAGGRGGAHSRGNWTKPPGPIAKLSVLRCNRRLFCLIA